MSASWTHQTAQDGSVASAYDAEASDSVSTGTQQQQQTSASLSQSNHTLGQQQVQQAQQTLSQLTPHQQAQLLQQAALHQQALQLAQAAQQPAKYVPPHLRGQPQAAGQAAAGYGVGPVGFPPLGAYGDGYAAPPANGQVVPGPNGVMYYQNPAAQQYYQAGGTQQQYAGGQQQAYQQQSQQMYGRQSTQQQQPRTTGYSNDRWQGLSQQSNGASVGGYSDRGGSNAYSSGYNRGGGQQGGYGNYSNNTAYNSSSGNTYNNNSQRWKGQGSQDFTPEEWTTPTPRDPTQESQLFQKANTGINFDKYEDIDVEVSGRDAPTAIQTSFKECDIHDIVRGNIEFASYGRPTPVQKNAIPIVLGQRDLMACAQTGSGKTAAFLVPILSRMFSSGPPNIPQGGNRRRVQYPLAIILAPTRELAIQIHDESLKFSYRSRVRPVVVYGGADIGTQFRDLEKGCHMIVATPGRLKDMVDRGKVSLEHVKYLVLDEADRMLDMGFEPQIRELVEQNQMPQPPMRQTLMFSATFPKDIQVLAQDFLNDYVFLAVGKVGSTSENITQSILWVPEEQKLDYLLDILSTNLNNNKKGLILVFVETKKGADILNYNLQRQNFSATCIHGDRNQRDREDALASFRNGETPVLVATAVAARGLDIPNVTLVINYDLPNDIAEYVHRIGRTGRVGNLGSAMSFFNDKNKNLAKDLLTLLHESNQEVPSFLESFAREFMGGKTTGYGGRSSYGGRGGSRGRGFSNFGGRDYRQLSQNPSSGYGAGAAGVGGGGYRGGQQQQTQSSSNFYRASTTNGASTGAGSNDQWWG